MAPRDLIKAAERRDSATERRHRAEDDPAPRSIPTTRPTQDWTFLFFLFCYLRPPLASTFIPLLKSMKERRSCQNLSLKSGMDPSQSVKCKIVVVGDSQCGKTALLHVFAKDCFPEVRTPPLPYPPLPSSLINLFWTNT